MQNTHKLLAAAMALPLALAFTAPATAAESNGWNDQRSNDRSETRQPRYDNRAAKGIERRLHALQLEINQARRSGELNSNQARNFNQQLKGVTRGYYASARNGLSSRDIRITIRQIGNVSDQLEAKRYRSIERTRANGRTNDRNNNGRQNRR